MEDLRLWNIEKADWFLESKQQKIKLRKPLSNKKELNLSFAAQGVTSVPTVKNHSTDYISLAITPLLKPLQGLFHLVEYLFLFILAMPYGILIPQPRIKPMPPARGKSQDRS